MVKIFEQQDKMIKMLNEINEVLVKYGMPETEEFEKYHGEFIKAIEKEIAPELYAWKISQERCELSCIEEGKNE